MIYKSTSGGTLLCQKVLHNIKKYFIMSTMEDPLKRVFGTVEDPLILVADTLSSHIDWLRRGKDRHVGGKKNKSEYFIINN